MYFIAEYIDFSLFSRLNKDDVYGDNLQRTTTPPYGDGNFMDINHDAMLRRLSSPHALRIKNGQKPISACEGVGIQTFTGTPFKIT